MTRQESILALGKEICRAAEGEEALLGLLCTAAEGAWTGRLRPGVRPEDCEETLRCACAFTAAAGILRSRGSGTPGFTAGSVSVRAGGAGETEGEEALLGLLCTAAEGAWTGRLRPGVRPEDCEETLRCACAFTAAAGILRSRGSGGLSFTAGSVSVRAGGAGETEGAARALEAQAEALMVPWCGEADFAFQGVRG